MIFDSDAGSKAPTFHHDLCHDHLPPFDLIRGRVETERGVGMTLHSLWQSSYYTWYNPLTAWPKNGRFEDWWAQSRHDFDNARATGFYRYQLPAFTDLYGVDFDTITDAQAREVNDRVFDHYRDRQWIYEVVTERANIELMVMDPYWDRLGFNLEYPFAVPTVNVTALIRGVHPSDFPSPHDSPYRFAARENLKLDSLDDYLVVLERILAYGKSKGAICLKTTTAYERTLDFANVSDVMGSNRILWGADAHHAEGIYAATAVTRRCLAEALAEKVERGELREEHALRIGTQIMRDNALELFPSLKEKLWKHKGLKMRPPAQAQP